MSSNRQWLTPAIALENACLFLEMARDDAQAEGRKQHANELRSYISVLRQLKSTYEELEQKKMYSQQQIKNLISVFGEELARKLLGPKMDIYSLDGKATKAGSSVKVEKKGDKWIFTPQLPGFDSIPTQQNTAQSGASHFFSQPDAQSFEAVVSHKNGSVKNGHK